MISLNTEEPYCTECGIHLAAHVGGKCPVCLDTKPKPPEDRATSPSDYLARYLNH